MVLGRLTSRSSIRAATLAAVWAGPSECRWPVPERDRMATPLGAVDSQLGTTPSIPLRHSSSCRNNTAISKLIGGQDQEIALRIRDISKIKTNKQLFHIQLIPQVDRLKFEFCVQMIICRIRADDYLPVFSASDGCNCRDERFRGGRVHRPWRELPNVPIHVHATCEANEHIQRHDVKVVPIFRGLQFSKSSGESENVL